MSPIIGFTNDMSLKLMELQRRNIESLLKHSRQACTSSKSFRLAASKCATSTRNHNWLPINAVTHRCHQRRRSETLRTQRRSFAMRCTPDCSTRSEPGPYCPKPSRRRASADRPQSESPPLHLSHRLLLSRESD